MLVLSPVPEIRNSGREAGGRGGGRWRCQRYIQVMRPSSWLERAGAAASATFIESLLKTREREEAWVELGDHPPFRVRGGKAGGKGRTVRDKGEGHPEDGALQSWVHKTGLPAVEVKDKRAVGALWVGLGLGSGFHFSQPSLLLMFPDHRPHPHP